MRRSTFAILLITAFSSMIGMGVIAPFLPVFAKQHGANGFWMGFIFAGFGISRGIIMPIVGRLSDRIGRKIFVAGGLFLFTVISLFYPLANSIFTLTIVRMVHGLAAGMIMPIVMAYVGDLAEEGKEGEFTGAVNMMFYLGLAAGPFLGGMLNHYFGFDSVFFAMSALGAVTFLIVVVFLPKDKGLEARKQEAVRSFHSLIRFNFIKAILIIAVVCALMMSVFVSFLPSLAAMINVNAFHVGAILSMGIFLAGILQVPFGRIADSHDLNGKLIQIGIGTSIGMLALFVMPLCPDFAALMAAASFVGLGAAVAAPALTSVSVGIGKKTGMGSWMGIFQCAMSIGFVVTPLVAGIVMDRLGIEAVFYTLAICAFFGALSYLRYVLRRIHGYKIG